ncbi:MAG TPA: lamin tail domain-containing protein, partial [Pyrinomonadaceae bacterium]|nr:lamin tail domain-containing protein [Pyrinomonadaceae bacterium]
MRAPLVINEILADVPPDNASTQVIEGDANRDGVRSSDDDEFVELFNYSDAPLDLSGIVVADATTNHYTFPANTTLAAGRAVVIFGGGHPPANDPAFGGALILTTGSLGLNDGGDTVTVKLPTTSGDIVIAAQSFGSAANNMPPAPSDQSLTRAPDAAVNDSGGAFVAHASATNANGRVFSPGTRADGTPFGAPALTRIEVTPTAAQLDIGARQTFSARAFANINGAETEVPSVSFIWDVGDATKATLAPQTGASTEASALAAGTTTVRARAGAQQMSATLTINPPPPVLTRVELTPTSATIITGQAQQFTARAFDQFNQPFNGATYNFTSDNQTVAQIEAVSNNADGSAVATVRGAGAGTAHINADATAGTTTVNSDAAMLTVNPPPPMLTRIVVSPSSATVAAGQMQQFTAQGFDQNDQPMGNLTFTWASNDQSVATIDASGLATSVNGGATQITASSGNVTSAPATLNVTAPPVPTAGQVIINEALVSFATSSTQTRNDFVELYNATTQTLDISGLVVSFRTSGTSNTPNTVTLPGAVGSLTTLIKPHNYFLIVNGASTFGVAKDFDASGTGFNMNDTTGGIKIEIGGVKLDGLTYQGGSTAPNATFIAYGEGTLLTFTSGT